MGMLNRFLPSGFVRRHPKTSAILVGAAAALVVAGAARRVFRGEADLVLFSLPCGPRIMYLPDGEDSTEHYELHIHWGGIGFDPDEEDLPPSADEAEPVSHERPEERSPDLPPGAVRVPTPNEDWPAQAVGEA